MTKLSKNECLLYALVLLKFIAPFLIQNGAYEPHRDEFLYLSEARHMAWGYMEVPPLLSVFAWLTNLFGGGMFWIKCWPSLFGALTVLMIGRLILSLGGKWFALVLGFLPFIVGGYLRVHYLFQPNFLDFFFWTLTAYALSRHIQSGKPGWLYLAGAGLGLGMLSKYSMLFFAVSLLGGLLLTGQRKILLSRHFWLALGLGFLLFLPNLLWQWHRGFPVVFHMNELQRTQLQYVSPWVFLTDQLFMNLPVIFVWLAGLYTLAFAKVDKPYRFLAWAFVLVITLLAVAHGKGYYALGAYPILFAFGAVALERWTGLLRSVSSGAIPGAKASVPSRGRRAWLVVLRCVMLLFALRLGYSAIVINLPFLPPAQLARFYADHPLVSKVGALRWEDMEDHPLPQDFSDMLGWKEMTAKVAKAYNMLDSSEKSQAFLFCDNYGEAGAVDYYGPRYHLPQVNSDNASFLYWLPEDYDRFNVFVLVTDDQQEMQHAFIHEFVSAQLVDSITTPYAREHGTLIILLKGPSERFRAAFREKIEKDREKTTAKGNHPIPPNPLDKGGSLH